MQIGTLRDRITVTRPLDPAETTQDSYGRDEGAAAAVGSFWCRVEPLQGRELEAARQKWANARYKVTLRRQSEITFSGKMLVAWGSRALEIVDVQSGGSDLRPVDVLICESYEVP